MCNCWLILVFILFTWCNIRVSDVCYNKGLFPATKALNSPLKLQLFFTEITLFFTESIYIDGHLLEIMKYNGLPVKAINRPTKNLSKSEIFSDLPNTYICYSSGNNDKKKNPSRKTVVGLKFFQCRREIIVFWMTDTMSLNRSDKKSVMRGCYNARTEIIPIPTYIIYVI